jgi:DNA-binding NarL/FixJ family response regulator
MRTLLQLESTLEVVAEARDGLEACEQDAAQTPDVVLMDLSMPVMSGVEATRRILASRPAAKVLVLTTFYLEQDVYAALRAGAAGYVLKNAPASEVVDAIRAVAAGDSYLQPSVAKQVVTEFNRLSRLLPKDVPELREALSGREAEIVRLLVRGKSNKDMAAELCITEGTVKNHLTSVFEKFGATDRTSVALKAKDMGMG